MSSETMATEDTSEVLQPDAILSFDDPLYHFIGFDSDDPRYTLLRTGLEVRARADRVAASAEPFFKAAEHAIARSNAYERKIGYVAGAMACAGLTDGIANLTGDYMPVGIGITEVAAGIVTGVVATLAYRSGRAKR